MRRTRRRAAGAAFPPARRELPRRAAPGCLRILRTLAFCGGAAVVVSAGCASAPSRRTSFAEREDGPVVVVSGERQVMGGVPARVHVAVPREGSVAPAPGRQEAAGPGPVRSRARAREVISLALDEIDRVESVLSAFRPGSELRRLAEAPPLEWVALGPDSAAVLGLSRTLWERSGGAFDVTVGPLMIAWGFHGSREPRIPSEDELARARARVGMQRLELDLPACRARLLAADMRLDAGAVAKGYAVDRAAEVVARTLADLREETWGALVEIGGEILALGTKCPGRPWTVGVERPRTRELVGKLALPVGGSLCAVASSADTWQYFVQDGRRYSHIIDPRTGTPKTGGVIGSTVLARDCATADGLATTLCVLEPEEGLRLVREWPAGAEALVFAEESGGLVRLEATSGFQLLDGIRETLPRHQTE